MLAAILLGQGGGPPVSSSNAEEIQTLGVVHQIGQTTMFNTSTGLE